ncbi:MAG: hypothetical protein HZB76_04860 [Chlamydiae bacterium]|nr:hypothetical protein [Chlamydiota bacterium]
MRRRQLKKPSRFRGKKPIAEVRKSFFTLLEIFLVLVIVAISSSVIGVKINTLLDKYNFESSFKKLNNYIGYCKEISFARQADIYLNLKTSTNGLICQITSDEDKAIFPSVELKIELLKNLFFKEPLDQLDVVFSSTYDVLPKVELSLCDGNEKNEKTLKIGEK